MAYSFSQEDTSDLSEARRAEALISGEADQRKGFLGFSALLTLLTQGDQVGTSFRIRGKQDGV